MYNLFEIFEHLKAIHNSTKYENGDDLKNLAITKCNIYEIVYKIRLLRYLKDKYFSNISDIKNAYINSYQCIKILLELISSKKAIVVNI